MLVAAGKGWSLASIPRRGAPTPTPRPQRVRRLVGQLLLGAQLSVQVLREITLRPCRGLCKHQGLSEGKSTEPRITRPSLHQRADFATRM